MNRPPDPDKTREIRTPAPSDRPVPKTPRPPVPEAPWWQSVNREVPPIPATPPKHPTPPPAPQPKGALASPRQARGSAPHPRALPPSPIPPPANAEPQQAPVSNPKGTPPTMSVRRPSRRRLLIRIGIGLVLAEAVVLGVVLSRLRASDTPVLDVAKAQRGVEQVLTDPVDGYGVKYVTDVVCNNGKNPPVRKGSGFECDAVVDGDPRRVAVVFQDDAGTYAVDRPR
jgi:hypothetical protein